MTTAVITGIFALVGVIVGGLLTAAVDLHIERRKRQAAIFQAKRLVGDELSTIVIHLDSLIENESAPLSDVDRRARFMPTAEWESYKEVLAQKDALSDDYWQELAHVLRAVGTLRLMVLELPPKSGLPPHLMDYIREQRQLTAGLHVSLTGRPIEA